MTIVCLSFVVSELYQFIHRTYVFAIFTHPSLVWSPCRVWNLTY